MNPSTISLDLPDALTSDDTKRLRAEWTATLEQLAKQVEAWVGSEPGWNVVRIESKEIHERLLGIYTVPVIEVQLPQASVVIEPFARNVGGKGTVEMLAFPTLRRVLLLHDVVGVKWQVLTDSGISLRQEWNQSNFVQLVRDLTEMNF